MPFIHWHTLRIRRYRIHITFEGRQTQVHTTILPSVSWTELCPPPRPKCWSPIPHPYPMTIFGEKTIEEEMKLKWGHKGKAVIPWYWCPFRNRKRQQISLSMNTQKWPSDSQEEGSRQKPVLLAPWSWTLILQNLQKRNFCCLGPCIWGDLLQQPKMTNSTSKHCGFAQAIKLSNLK